MKDGNIEIIEAESEYAKRALDLAGGDVMGIMAECAQVVSDERIDELMEVAKDAMSSACDAIERASNDQFEQILATSSMALSLMATILSWVDFVNLEIEIAEIERGLG